MAEAIPQGEQQGRDKRERPTPFKAAAYPTAIKPPERLDFFETVPRLRAPPICLMQVEFELSHGAMLGGSDSTRPSPDVAK
jgi:hypothetical protein